MPDRVDLEQTKIDLAPRAHAEARVAELTGRLFAEREALRTTERELAWWEDGIALDMFPTNGPARDVLAWISAHEEEEEA